MILASPQLLNPGSVGLSLAAWLWHLTWQIHLPTGFQALPGLPGTVCGSGEHTWPAEVALCHGSPRLACCLPGFLPLSLDKSLQILWLQLLHPPQGSSRVHRDRVVVGVLRDLRNTGPRGLGNPWFSLSTVLPLAPNSDLQMLQSESLLRGSQGDSSMPSAVQTELCACPLWSQFLPLWRKAG